MSNADLTNALHYRQIKSGIEYDNLLPKKTCTPTYLGDGTTYFTLSEMKKWAIQHKSQLAKLAPKLQGNTLQQTVNNVYKFCHDHLQYNKDGWEQNLRSPACTWYSRKDGIDCKSYALFVSCLLLNLKINHFFRKVRLDPKSEEFDHVYVIVPTDQTTNSKKNYVIIDPTLHTNNELEYLEPYDITMLNMRPHYGLNGVDNAGLNNVIEPLSVAISGLNNFLSELIGKGLNIKNAEAIRTYVRGQVAMGKDPFFKPVENGLLVDGKFWPISKYDGLAGDPDVGDGGGDGDGGGSGKGWFTAVVHAVIKAINWDGFGAFFQNGWRFSCFGVSSSPKEAEEWVKNELIPYVESKLGAIKDGIPLSQLSAKLTNIDRDLNVIIAHQAFHKSESAAKCSKEGNQAKVDATTEFLEAVKARIALLKQKYNIKITSKNVTASNITPVGFAINWKGNVIEAKYNEYVISNKNGSTNDVFEDVNDKDENGNPIPQPKPKPKSNNLTNLALGGAALAAIFFMPVATKDKKKPTAKKPITRRKPTIRRKTTTTRPRRKTSK